MPKWSVRKLKILFIENDSALRSLLTTMLGSKIDVIGSFATTAEALRFDEIKSADAALIDFALERDGLNGVELGIALRSLNENIGIAIYSQHEVEPLINRVPVSMRPGWSFFEKSASMLTSDYVEILSQTALGKGNWQEFDSVAADEQSKSVGLLLALSGRQRAVMELASSGKSTTEIARSLDMTYAYVRKELSRIYAILVPDATAAVDLKTAAVLKYLEIANISGNRKS